MGKKLTSDEARAASAHARINLPLNLAAWADVPAEWHPDMLWFHQFILDQGMDFKAVEEAVGYNWNTVYKFLTGTSTGSYGNFCAAIATYRKIAEKRKTIQRQEFVHNSISQIVFATLDYTFANNCMTLIVGESGMGKSTIMQAWRDENNHGTSVYVDCPPVGGIKGFLGAIAHAVGVGNAPIPSMLAAVTRAFNVNRILLLDNMHRALPGDPRTAAKLFDVVQYLFDGSGCAVGMSATARLDAHMRQSTQMFEQTTGRVGIPVHIPREVGWKDIAEIVRQYIPSPSEETRRHAMRIANAHGHIRQLVERLKVASRIAAKAKEPITDEHFLTAIRVRAELARHNTAVAAA